MMISSRRNKEAWREQCNLNYVACEDNKTDIQAIFQVIAFLRDEQKEMKKRIEQLEFTQAVQGGQFI